MTDHRMRITYQEGIAMGDEIAEISSQIDAATHRLLACIRRFDELEGWAGSGALTCAHWLTWRIGVGPGTAREYVRVARALGSLPKIDEALRRGQVSYSKVRALTRQANRENEAYLLEWATHSTGAQLEKVLAKYQQVLRHCGHIPVDEPEFRYVRRRHTASGMVRVEAQLLPEEAEIVWKALATARERIGRKTERDVSAETSEEEAAERVGEAEAVAPPSPAEQYQAAQADRVDGLLYLAECALAGQVGEPPAGPPVEIVIHAEASTIAATDSSDAALARASAQDAALESGRRLEPETTGRLFCDAALVEMVEDETGTPLDVGRRTRTISSAMKRALRARDGGCRFPGCNRARTDGHHIVPWSEGGETKLGNLVSLCRRHHRFVHEGGWRIEVRAGSEILFFDTLENVVPAAPISAVLQTDAIEELRSSLADEGIDIDSQTAYPRASERVDYGMAVQSLYYAYGPGRDEARRLRGDA